jgi:Asp-tRNA(Asn)/Glu-tRNA(Gln) amidotransferase A subunit family amidase
MTPLIAFARTAVWDQAEEETRDAFGELVDLLGDACADLPLSEPFDHAVEMHRNIMNADLAKNLAGYYERGKDELTDTLCEMIELGQKVSAVDYNKAVEGRELLNTGLNAVFDFYDVILTPASPGTAPVGLDATGNPIFSTLWTYCGVPAVTLPLMHGGNGMPLGVQLVGPRGDDARLLRTARWLANRVADDGENQVG